jgi:hypothetical protein
MDETKSEPTFESLEAWKEHREAGDQSVKQLFQQVSRIAQYMSYDLIDKLQYWERETLKLSDEEVEKRLTHMSTCLTHLQTAYDGFSDVDL